MTRSDLRWRAAESSWGVGGCIAGLLDRDGSPLVLAYFVAAILGLALIVNGKRVGIVWRAERRGHGYTATAIHAQRVRRFVQRRGSSF